MNLTEINELLEKKLGYSNEESESMLDATIEAIKEYAKDLDTIAIPGFGTLSCTKIDEQVSMNNVTGTQMLTPPQIKLSFKSSVVLRKKIVG